MPKLSVKIIKHDPTDIPRSERTKALTALIFSSVSDVDGRPES
jgi:hypothetical protein